MWGCEKSCSIFHITTCLCGVRVRAVCRGHVSDVVGSEPRKVFSPLGDFATFHQPSSNRFAIVTQSTMPVWLSQVMFTVEYMTVLICKQRSGNSLSQHNRIISR